MRFFNVRTKLIFSVLIILSLSCVLIGWFSYGTAYRQVSKKTLEGMRRNVEILNCSIEQTIELRKRETLLIAGLTNAGDIGPRQGDEDPAIRAMLDGLIKQNPEMGNPLVASDQGAYMISPKSAVFTDPDYDPRGRDWYKLAMANPGEAMLSRPILSKVKDAGYVVPVSAATADRRGVFVISIPLAEWTRSVNQSKIGESGFVYMLDSDGGFIAGPQGAIGTKAEAEPYASILARPSGAIRYKADGRQKQAIFLTNDLTGWKIVGEIDQEEINQAVRPIFQTTLFVLLGALLLSAGIISLIIRSIIRPLHTLAAASDRIGEGDLSGHVTIDSDDEFKKLGDAFNHMVDSLRTFAFYDPLTNLPNRRQFANSMQRAVEHAEAAGAKPAIVFLDIDNFKRINDTLGHTVGDGLLGQAANRLTTHFGAEGTVARFGGDEFVILLEDAPDRERLKALMDTIGELFLPPFMIQEQRIVVKASIGAAVYPEHGLSGEELLKNADTAMYRAKELGRNNAQFFEGGMNDAVVKKSRMEQALRTALDNNELSVHYQPQLETTTGRIRGFEALARWHHPELGAISPMEFIPIAEEAGLIGRIDAWVMREACLRTVELQRAFGKPYSISVNVSAVELRQSGLAEIIARTLRDTKLRPECLEIEITESVLIDSLESSTAVLREVERLGVRIALDDFGTGYSSLSYLMSLPIHTLKIDKSFIQNMAAAAGEKAIVESIIALVHKLGHQVVAEGIETEEQLALLKNWDCDYVQGYLHSRPVPEPDLPSLIAAREAAAAVDRG
ncbi:EAL domain-containing protein [Paenibacillus lycopersici]|uniref:EAL domain-containing protein n=1 Tax=Paenibacillus lycopersici TaxID=2704462 RepID=A0A6C0G5T9_9BACL|nr:EAL domain-containing protein [Paenibacillus lycopersici]QHT63109.1 EAL domain-containing protein [Paenibacillus lycopersici]